MMILFLLLVTLAALALSAFCAGAETGFLSIRRGRLTHLVRAGSPRALILQKAYQKIGDTTTALLIGNNLASVTYSSAVAALATRFFADEPVAQSVWSIFAALTFLSFGEFAPKLLCASRPLRRMLMLVPAWKIFAALFSPLGSVILRLIRRFVPKREMNAPVTPDMVMKILADRKDGVKLSNLESALIERILRLREKGMFVTPESLLCILDECVV